MADRRLRRAQLEALRALFVGCCRAERRAIDAPRGQLGARSARRDGRARRCSSAGTHVESELWPAGRRASGGSTLADVDAGGLPRWCSAARCGRAGRCSRGRGCRSGSRWLPAGDPLRRSSSHGCARGSGRSTGRRGDSPSRASARRSDPAARAATAASSRSPTRTWRVSRRPCRRALMRWTRCFARAGCSGARRSAARSGGCGGERLTPGELVAALTDPRALPRGAPSLPGGLRAADQRRLRHDASQAQLAGAAVGVPWTSATPRSRGCGAGPPLAHARVHPLRDRARARGAAPPAAPGERRGSHDRAPVADQRALLLRRHLHAGRRGALAVRPAGRRRRSRWSATTCANVGFEKARRRQAKRRPRDDPRPRARDAEAARARRTPLAGRRAALADAAPRRSRRASRGGRSVLGLGAVGATAAVRAADRGGLRADDAGHAAPPPHGRAHLLPAARQAVEVRPRPRDPDRRRARPRDRRDHPPRQGLLRHQRGPGLRRLGQQREARRPARALPATGRRAPQPDRLRQDPQPPGAPLTRRRG